MEQLDPELMRRLADSSPRLVLPGAFALALGALLGAGVLSAGSLSVNAGAAASGAFGLEVTPGSGCSAPEAVDLVSQLVIADVEACSFLTALSTTVAGDVDFTAGVSIAFGEDFQVSAGSDFAAVLDTSLTRLAFVRDDSPAEVASYRASFHLRLDELVISLTDKFGHLTGLSRDGLTWFEVRLKRNLLPLPGEDRLVLAARETDGTMVETTFGQEVMLPAGFNLIEIDWLAGAGTGRLLVSLNGVPFGGLIGLDNASGRIDSVRWGVTAGNVEGTGGSLDVDDFTSSE